MKSVLIVIILILVSTASWGERWAPDDDKQLHAIAGTMISFAYPVIHTAGLGRTESIIATIALSTTIAALKEVTDPTFSTADLTYTVGSTVICIVGWDYLVVPTNKGIQIAFRW